MYPHEKAGNLVMTGVESKEEFLLPKHLASFYKYKLVKSKQCRLRSCQSDPVEVIAQVA